MNPVLLHYEIGGTGGFFLLSPCLQGTSKEHAAPSYGLHQGWEL